MILLADSEDSDQTADAQTDLCLHWLHMPEDMAWHSPDYLEIPLTMQHLHHQQEE